MTSTSVVIALYRSILKHALKLQSNLQSSNYSIVRAIRSGEIQPNPSLSDVWRLEKQALQCLKHRDAHQVVRDRFNVDYSDQRVDEAFDMLRSISSHNALIQNLVEKQCFAPKNRDGKLKFNVGDVVQVRNAPSGVIVGWELSKHENQGPVYSVLLDQHQHQHQQRRVSAQHDERVQNDDSGDDDEDEYDDNYDDDYDDDEEEEGEGEEIESVRYIHESDMTLLQEPKAIHHPSIPAYFSSFQHGAFQKCEALALRYPQDKTHEYRCSTRQEQGEQKPTRQQQQLPTVLQIQKASEQELLSYLKCHDDMIAHFAQTALEARWLHESGEEARRGIDEALRLISKDQNDKASKILSHLVRAYPKWASAWEKLGVCQLGQGLDKAALESFHRALTCKDDHLGALAGTATCALRLHIWPLAYGAAVNLADIHPCSAIAKRVFEKVDQAYGEIYVYKTSSSTSSNSTTSTENS